MSTSSNIPKENVIKSLFAAIGIEAMFGTKVGENDATPPGTMDGVFRMQETSDDLYDTFGKKGIAKRFDNWIQNRLKEGLVKEMPDYKSCYEELNLLLKWRVPENIKRMKAVKAKGHPGIAVIPCIMSIPLTEIPSNDDFKKFTDSFSRNRPLGKFFDKKKCVVCPMMAVVVHKGRFIIAFQVQFFMPDNYEEMKDMYD